LDDDEQVEEIGREYGSGRMTTKQIKSTLIDVLQRFVAEH
jgi:tryptophanyl-tRNA synthetase